MPIVRLRIATDLLLDPGFPESPASFARARGVPLVGDVSTATSYKTDPDNYEKAAEIEANIHLVQHGAIRLLAELDGGGVRLRSIDLNPSMLRYGLENHPITEGDLLVSLTTLRDSVAPLLADVRDACHIVPGLADGAGPVSYWSAIASDVFLPGVLLPCLHDLYHPLVGAAEGVSKARIQLGNGGDNYIIRFEKSKCVTAGPDGVQEKVDGLRVRLMLEAHALPAVFGSFGTTALVKKVRRLVAFPSSGLARVHRAEMSNLEGTCLPVPPAWRDKSLGKPLTHAKVLSLVSQLTTIPVAELCRIDGQLRQPSDLTRERLDEDLLVEASRLAPVPASTLFGPEIYASPVPGSIAATDGRIDPLVARHYGSG